MKNGVRIEPYIDDYWFNRKAYILSTYKEKMETYFGVLYEDREMNMELGF